MYLRLVFHYPQLGKNAELSSLIEEHVKAENDSGGSRNAFLTTMIHPWPEMGPAMVHAIRHEDFGAWEKHISERSPSFQSYASKMLTLSVRFPTQQVHEVIAREAGSTPARFVWQTIHTPQPGKGGELRKLLAQRVETSLKRGSTSSQLLASVFDSTCSTAVGFADLASFEAYRKDIQADAATAKWAAELNSVSAGPAVQVLARAVVPFPIS